MKKRDQEMRDLVEGSSQGHADSCKKLYEVLVDSVYGYVRSRTSTNEQATDLTQDVFIDLFSAIQNFTYSTRGQFYSYLFVIVRRKLSKLYADANMRSKNTETEFIEEQISDTSISSLEEKGISDEIQLAVRSLNEIAREIIVLHHWSGYTFSEIALLLKMEESAVRVRHHRALKLLAKTLCPN